jgi:D-lactate dehydrogenase (cytochrome)
MASGEVRLNATPALACPPKPDCPIPKPALEALISILGDRLSFGLAEREQHGRGESYHATVPPDAVCYALSTEEVSRIVHVRAAHRVAIIPFGAGTSLEGHVAALKGGLCIDLSRTTRIIAVHAEDLDVTLEAGVTRQQLNEHLRDNRPLPVDPGGESTSHPRLRHQCGPLRETMRENVVSLIAVIADGQVVRTASRARKSSAGYDLTRLVGSEGTLGIISFFYIKEPELMVRRNRSNGS